MENSIRLEFDTLRLGNDIETLKELLGELVYKCEELTGSIAEFGRLCDANGSEKLLKELESNGADLCEAVVSSLDLVEILKSARLCYSSCENESESVIDSLKI